jgi:hypothetical protein
MPTESAAYFSQMYVNPLFLPSCIPHSPHVSQEASDAFAEGVLKTTDDMGNRAAAMEDEDGNLIEPVMYTTATGFVYCKKEF